MADARGGATLGGMEVSGSGFLSEHRAPIERPAHLGTWVRYGRCAGLDYSPVEPTAPAEGPERCGLDDWARVAIRTFWNAESPRVGISTGRQARKTQIWTRDLGPTTCPRPARTLASPSSHLPACTVGVVRRRARCAEIEGEKQLRAK
jgi:hypothetical protein